MINFYSGFVYKPAAEHLQKRIKKEVKLRADYPDKEKFYEVRNKLREKDPMPKGSVATVVDHIEHVIKVAGIDHVGLGADYDGVGTLPEQLEDVSTYPYITQELLNRGYKKPEIKKILGENLLRAMDDMQRVAKSIKKS